MLSWCVVEKKKKLIQNLVLTGDEVYGNDTIPLIK